MKEIKQLETVGEVNDRKVGVFVDGLLVDTVSINSLTNLNEMATKRKASVMAEIDKNVAEREELIRQIEAL